MCRPSLAAFSRMAIFHAPRDEHGARMRIYAANCFSLFLFANIQPERMWKEHARNPCHDRKEDEYDKNLIAPRIGLSGSPSVQKLQPCMEKEFSCNGKNLPCSNIIHFTFHSNFCIHFILFGKKNKKIKMIMIKKTCWHSLKINCGSIINIDCVKLKRISFIHLKIYILKHIIFMLLIHLFINWVILILRNVEYLTQNL